MAANFIDITADNFEQAVVERSYEKLVLVDFWAPWCAPCRALTPILHKLADAYQAKMVLAKVNTDEEQDLAMRFDLRGIPHVKAFLNGEMVDEFSGVLPEGAIREFIERHLPSPIDKLMQRAQMAIAQSDVGLARKLLSDVLMLDTGYDPANLLLASIAIEQHELIEARQFLDLLSPLARESLPAKQLLARLSVAERVSSLPDIAALTSSIARNAGDLQARLDLATVYIGEANYAAALDHLLDIVRRQRGFADGAARKQMLEIFALLGNQGELVSRYRKMLAMALT